jgi:TnpA family transposase
MPLPLLTRQDGAAIEGALRMRTVLIDRVMTDSHGQTAFGMALAQRLGFDLCPRLKSRKDRRLHVPRGFCVPQTLRQLCIADIALNPIEEGFEDFAALADAVAAGKLDAVTACQRHGSAARHRKAYKAGRPIGLLLRTLHMCETATNDEFRREQLRLLNHGELVHFLQRQIRRDGFGTLRGMRHEELVAQSGSLTLITNAVMAFNAHEQQAILDRWQGESGRRISPAILRRLSPTPFGHINFVGAMEFVLQGYRDRIFAPRRRGAGEQPY